MRQLMLATGIAVALTACGGRTEHTDAATQAPAATAATTLADVELIPREALFGNPERAGVQLSPDGQYLSWIAPVDGTMNVWVAPASDP
ncbi:MAG: S9 family peptidase, partial [Luteimonas sp.]